jgi:hypothetical protein
MRRIPRGCGWEGLVAHLDAGVKLGESRPLGDESETFVRLLASA